MQKIELRPYQVAMVDAIATSLMKHSRVVGVAPTASGKSLIVASIAKRFLERNKSESVLVLCNTAEILKQNEEKCHAIGLKDTGIYCAGTGRKETSAKVVFASRDSLGRNPTACGYRALVIVDEAHLLAEDDASMYQRIFAAIQPVYCVGLTGTPWRMDNGLIYGKNKFWQKCADKIHMETLRDAGFLAPYALPEHMPQLIDTTGLRVTGGDFNQKDLTARSITEQVVAACVEQWWSQAQDRRSSLFFCCSRDHAAVVTRHLSALTPRVAYLDGATSKSERDTILRAAKEGKYKAIVNVGVLTTGTDIPILDCVVLLRATQSVSLFVQMIGRGLRVYLEKRDCLVLDYAGNFERFGSVENPRTPKGKKGGADENEVEAILAAEGITLEPGTAPEKTCPACEARTYAAATRCKECGHVFFNHGIETLTSGDLSGAGILRVCGVVMQETHTRKGVPCVVVDFQTECGQSIKQWLFHKQPGFQAWHARQAFDLLAQGVTHVRKQQAQSEKYPKVTPLRLPSFECVLPTSLIEA